MSYNRPDRIEFTIGVCVPMIWDDERSGYIIDSGSIELTVGGLFDDAENGVWDPATDEWIGVDSPELSDAAALAHWMVSAAIVPFTREETP